MLYYILEGRQPFQERCGKRDLFSLWKIGAGRGRLPLLRAGFVGGQSGDRSGAGGFAGVRAAGTAAREKTTLCRWSSCGRGGGGAGRGVPGSWRKKAGGRLAVGTLADALRRVCFVFRGGSAGPQAATYGPQRGALVLAGSGDLGAAVRLYGCRAVPGRRKFPPDEPGFCLSVSAGRAWRGGPRKGAAMPREGQRHDHIVGGRH